MKKNTYLLGAVLLILLVAAYYVMNMPGEVNKSTEQSRLFLSVDSSAVDKIEVKSQTSDVTLEKVGSTWYVSSPVYYRADQQAVARAVHACKALLVLNLVSDKPEKFSLFHVDSTGTLVHLFQNGTMKSAFVIGKMGPDYTDSYVRMADANQVMLAKGVLEYTFSRQLKEWRDRTIINIPRDEITGVSVRNGKESYQLAKKDSVWLLDGKSAKLSAVNSLIASLSNVQADDFEDSALTPAPKISSSLSFAGMQLRFAEDGKDKYYVQASNSAQWFIVEGWRAKEILKEKKDLLE
ncbi:MAG: DUF4340 domain-containing protein [Bacteroidota bacterium]|nr:DUF4340 domain-containing protein [Bacteroidota bacterium]